MISDATIPFVPQRIPISRTGTIEPTAPVPVPDPAASGEPAQSAIQTPIRLTVSDLANLLNKAEKSFLSTIPQQLATVFASLASQGLLIPLLRFDGGAQSWQNLLSEADGALTKIPPMEEQGNGDKPTTSSATPTVPSDAETSNKSNAVFLQRTLTRFVDMIKPVVGIPAASPAASPAVSASNEILGATTPNLIGANIDVIPAPVINAQAQKIMLSGTTAGKPAAMPTGGSPGLAGTTSITPEPELAPKGMQSLAQTVTNILQRVKGNNPLGQTSLAGLNVDFLSATRGSASLLLTTPTPLMPLNTRLMTTATATAPLETLPTASGGSPLDLMLQLVSKLSEDLIDGEQSPLERLTRIVRDLQRIQGGDSRSEVTLSSATQALKQLGNPLQEAMQRGFSFELEVRQSSRTEATITQLRENGFSAVQVAATQEQTVRIRVTVGGANQQQRSDPVVLDLNGDGKISLTNQQQGQDFDITGDGRTERTAFVAGGDAFLALDRNNDGRITSGRELFSDQWGARNGMSELARFDVNRDGFISQQDPIFKQLVAFFDANRDGIIDPDEHKPISQLGIQRLQLEYKPVEVIRDDGNIISAIGKMLMENGEEREIADVDLLYQN